MAIHPVVIDFIATHVPDVARAIHSVQDAMVDASTKSTRAVSHGVDLQEREYQELARVAEKWRKEALRETEKAAKAETAAVEKAAREQANAEKRAAQASAKERIAIARQVAAEETRLRMQIAKLPGGGNVEGPPHPTSPQARLAVLEGVRHAPTHEQQAALHKVGELHIVDQSQRTAASEAEKVAQAKARAADKAAKAEAAAAAAAAKAETKAAQQAARDKAAAMKEADREIAKANAAARKDFEKGEREKNREAMKWVRQREREIRAEQAETNRQRKRYAEAVVGGAAGAARTGVRGAIGLAQTAVSLGGGFSVQDALHERMTLDRESVGFINAAEDKTGLDAKAISRGAIAASKTTGIDANQLLAASRAFLSKTGNAQEALSNQQLFGEIAKGTGAKIEDVAAAAGTLRVQNKHLTPEAMKETLLQIVKQGQLGSVEFSDLARSVGKITKSSASYAGDQTTNQAKLLGLAQVAMATSGSPQEASTVVSNIAMDAMKHNDKVTAALGAKAFNKQGQIAEAPEEFIANVMAKTGGNLQKIQAMGFGARSMKMFQALAPDFNEATAQGKSGREAVLQKMKEATATPMTYGELQSNVSKVMATDAEQFDAAVRQLKNDFADKLGPELPKLASALREITPQAMKLLGALTDMAVWAAHNPLAAAIAGLGASITKSVLSEVASAKLGDLLKKLLSGGAGGGGGGFGKMGAVGKVAAGVGAALVVGEVGREWIDSGYAEEHDKANARSSRLLEAQNLASAALHGSLTPEQKERMQKLTGELQADQKQQQQEMTDPSWVKKVTGGVGLVADSVVSTFTGERPVAEAQQVEQREQARALDATNKMIEKLTQTIEKSITTTEANTNATRENSKSGDGGGASRDPGMSSPNHPARGAPLPLRSGQ